MVDKYGENSEYIVEEMESTNDDYKLIKKLFLKIQSETVQLKPTRFTALNNVIEMKQVNKKVIT